MDATSSNRLSRVLEAAAQGLSGIANSRVEVALSMFKQRTENLKLQQDANFKQQEIDLKQKQEQDTAAYHKQDIEMRGNEAQARLSEAQKKDSENETYRKATLDQGDARLDIERQHAHSSGAVAEALRQQNADTATANSLRDYRADADRQINNLRQQRETAIQKAKAATIGTDQQVEAAGLKAGDAFDQAHSGDLDRYQKAADMSIDDYKREFGIAHDNAASAPSTPPGYVPPPGAVVQREGGKFISDGKKLVPYQDGKQYISPYTGKPLKPYDLSGASTDTGDQDSPLAAAQPPALPSLPTLPQAGQPADPTQPDPTQPAQPDDAQQV